jgi:hypothetical protein
MNNNQQLNELFTQKTFFSIKIFSATAVSIKGNLHLYKRNGLFFLVPCTGKRADSYPYADHKRYRLASHLHPQHTKKRQGLYSYARLYLR